MHQQVSINEMIPHNNLFLLDKIVPRSEKLFVHLSLYHNGIFSQIILSKPSNNYSRGSFEMNKNKDFQCNVL